MLAIPIDRLEEIEEEPRQRSWSKLLCIGSCQWGAVCMIHLAAFMIFVDDFRPEIWEDFELAGFDMGVFLGGRQSSGQSSDVRIAEAEDVVEIFEFFLGGIVMADVLGWMATRCVPRNWTATRYMPVAIIWFTLAAITPTFVTVVFFVDTFELGEEATMYMYAILLGYTLLWFVLGVPFTHLCFAIHRRVSKSNCLRIFICLVALIGLAAAAFTGQQLADQIASTGAIIASAIAGAAAAVSAAASTAVSTVTDAATQGLHNADKFVNGVEAAPGGDVPDAGGNVPDAGGNVPDAGGEVPDAGGEGNPDAGGEGNPEEQKQDTENKNEDESKNKRRKKKKNKRRDDEEKRAPPPVVGKYVEIVAESPNKDGTVSKPVRESLLVKPAGSCCLRALLSVFKCGGKRSCSYYKQVQAEGIEHEEVLDLPGKWVNFGNEKTWICQESNSVITTGGLPQRPEQPELISSSNKLRAVWNVPYSSMAVEKTWIEIRKCNSSTDWTGTIITKEVHAPADSFVIDMEVVPGLKLGDFYQVRVACENRVGRGPFSKASLMAAPCLDKVAMQKANWSVQQVGPIEFQATEASLKGDFERQQIHTIAKAVMHVMQPPFPGILLTGYARPAVESPECIADAQAMASQRAGAVQDQLVMELKRLNAHGCTETLPPIVSQSAQYDNNGLRVEVRLSTPVEESEVAYKEAQPPEEDQPHNSARRQWEREVEPKDPKVQKLKSFIPCAVLSTVAALNFIQEKTNVGVSLCISVVVTLVTQFKCIQQLPTVQSLFKALNGEYTKLLLGLVPAVPAFFSGFGINITVAVTLVISSVFNFLQLERVSSMFMAITNIPLFVIALLQWFSDQELAAKAGTAVLLAASAVVKSASDLLKADELEVSVDVAYEKTAMEAKQKLCHRTGLSPANLDELIHLDRPDATDLACRVLRSLADQLVRRMGNTAKAAFAGSVAGKFNELQQFMQEQVQEETRSIVRALKIDEAAKKGDKLVESACVKLQPSVKRFYMKLDEVFTKTLDPHVEACRAKVVFAQTFLKKFDTSLKASETLLAANLETLLNMQRGLMVEYLREQVTCGIENLRKRIGAKVPKLDTAIFAHIEQIHGRITFLRKVTESAIDKLKVLMQFYEGLPATVKHKIGVAEVEDAAKKGFAALEVACDELAKMDERVSSFKELVRKAQASTQNSDFAKVDELLQKVLNDAAALLGDSASVVGSIQQKTDSSNLTAAEAFKILEESMVSLSENIGRLEDKFERFMQGCRFFQPIKDFTASQLDFDFSFGLQEDVDFQDQFMEVGKNLDLDPAVVREVVMLHGKAQQMTSSIRTVHSDLQAKVNMANQYVIMAKRVIASGEKLKGITKEMLEQLNQKDASSKALESLCQTVEETMSKKVNGMIEMAEELAFDVMDHVFDIIETALRKEVASLFPKVDDEWQEDVGAALLGDGANGAEQDKEEEATIEMASEVAAPSTKGAATMKDRPFFSIVDGLPEKKEASSKNTSKYSTAEEVDVPAREKAVDEIFQPINPAVTTIEKVASIAKAASIGSIDSVDMSIADIVKVASAASIDSGDCISSVCCRVKPVTE